MGEWDEWDVLLREREISHNAWRREYAWKVKRGWFESWAACKEQEAIDVYLDYLRSLPSKRASKRLEYIEMQATLENIEMQATISPG